MVFDHNTKTMQQAVKGPKIIDVKLFIQDENRPYLQKILKKNNNEHKQQENHWFLAREIKLVEELNMFIRVQPHHKYICS